MEKEYLYNWAREQYAVHGVDTEKALKIISEIPVSIHCWQGDDVAGFEKEDSNLSNGGIQVTGNYPGKARNSSELKADIEKALSLIPGKHRINLHACYGDFTKTGFKDRNLITKENFTDWVDWAKDKKVSLDFNATNFSHPKATGLTLANPNDEIRNFWIEHNKKCREISDWMGKELGEICVHNLWIPDGMKDIPADRRKFREILKSSLDEIFMTKYSDKNMLDSVESKVFGIGTESFVVGSHEFYMGYALKNDLLLTLDMGHFHCQENVADKISSVLMFTKGILMHMSRGVRWDSDHVTIQNDDIASVCQEIINQGEDGLKKIHIGLDFFDGSINRIGAWVTGSRAVEKSLLSALLQPQSELKKYEDQGKYFERLYTMETAKTLPFGIIWNEYCKRQNIALDSDVIININQYEAQVTSKRN